MFTHHGHGTWMPDHPKGYVHRTRGLQSRDLHMAARYRENQRGDAVRFDDGMRALLMQIARDAGSFINAAVHGCAMESTHIHVLVSWKHQREWKSMRTSIRSAMTRGLNQKYGKRDWFSDSPSRKRVADHEHFDYLILEYLRIREAGFARKITRRRKREINGARRQCEPVANERGKRNSRVATRPRRACNDQRGALDAHRGRVATRLFGDRYANHIGFSPTVWS
jgi:hypothetical protein